MHREMLPFSGALTLFLLFTVQEINANCQNDSIPMLTYRILDEFRDERTTLVEGGWIEFTCNSAGVIFNAGSHNPIQSSEDVKIEIRGEETILEVQIRSSGFFAEKFLQGRGLECQCSKDPMLYSYAVGFEYAVCDRREHTAELQPCRGNELCLLTDSRHSVSGGKCGRMDGTFCPKDKEDVRWPRQKHWYRICGASSSLSETECDAVKDALDPKKDSPMVQVRGTRTLVCQDAYVNFWQGNLTLWHNILFSQSYTLKPRDTSQCNSSMNCRLKLMTNQGAVQSQSLSGDCRHGWMVSVAQISTYKKSKVVCKMTDRLQWHFLLYNTKVKAECVNDTVQCTWPLWMGVGIEVVPGNGSCLKNVSFPYPISQKEQVFSVRSDHQPCIRLSTSTDTTGYKSTFTVSTNTTEAGNQTLESHLHPSSLTVRKSTSGQSSRGCTDTTVTTNGMEVRNGTRKFRTSILTRLTSSDHTTASPKMNTFENSSLSTTLPLSPKSRKSSAAEEKTSGTLVETTSLNSRGSTSPWWFWMVIAILGLVLFLGLLGTVLLVFYRRWMSHRNIEITDSDSDDSVEDSS